jgi:N-acetylglucosamine-6-phosphate deacetylase
MNEASTKSLLLHDARLILPDAEVERGAVLIEDGRIREVFSGDVPVPVQVDERIDLSGLTLFPGFIDIHIHGAVGVDTLAASAADIDRVSQFLATQGVTGWLPTLVPGSTQDYIRAIAAIGGADNTLGARVLGVHYEGPFVNSHQCGALRPQFLRSYSGASDLDDLPQLADQNSRHLITLAPEIAGGIELVRELRRRNWIVSIGHTRADFTILDEALAAGACHMTHFMNAMGPLHHRSPGPIGWGLAHDDVTCDVIADGVHLDREMLRLLLKLKGAERVTLISDAIAAAGRGDGDYEIWEQTITVKDGRTSNAAGSIAGSVISMLDAVGVMKSVGASAVELARMAATNPARLLGIDHDCGTIETGKRADLVALAPDGSVGLTVVDGAIGFDARKR